MRPIQFNPKAQRRFERAALAARCAVYQPARETLLRDALYVAAIAFTVAWILL